MDFTFTFLSSSSMDNVICFKLLQRLFYSTDHESFNFVIHSCDQNMFVKQQSLQCFLSVILQHYKYTQVALLSKTLIRKSLISVQLTKVNSEDTCRHTYGHTQLRYHTEYSRFCDVADVKRDSYAVYIAIMTYPHHVNLCIYSIKL